MGQRVPQLPGMLQTDIGDHGHFRGRDHIGGIHASSQANLQYNDITASLQKIEHPHHSHQFKLCGRILHPLSRLNDPLRDPPQGVIWNRHTIHLEPLVKAPQMWRCIQPYCQPRLVQHGGHHCSGRAFPVGSGYVDIF